MVVAQLFRDTTTDLASADELWVVLQGQSRNAEIVIEPFEVAILIPFRVRVARSVSMR
jgi:hypothetical protein